MSTLELLVPPKTNHITYKTFSNITKILIISTVGGKFSLRSYLKKCSPIELCVVDKGLGGRQYQKTTLASNPIRD
jgi:hypothetical protein